MPHKIKSRNGERGNVVFFVLLGIILIALVTAAIRSGGGAGENIDREQLVIAASTVRQYASELERAVAIIEQNGISESDIRFAHPEAHSDYGDITSNPARQVFDRKGGGAQYKKPSGVNDGSAWEFYGTTTLPEVGSPARGDLIAVLPAVDKKLCEKLNKTIGYDPATQPEDTGTCMNGGSSQRFNDSHAFDDSGPNTVDDATFSRKPSMEGCVRCADGKYYYYHVLIAR